MAQYLKYAKLLEGEARRHMKLASVAEEPAVGLAHLDVALALLISVKILREEAMRRWRSCPSWEKKRHLSLRPLTPGYQLSANEK